MYCGHLELEGAMCIDCFREEGAGEKTWSQKGHSNKITEKFQNQEPHDLYS